MARAHTLGKTQAFDVLFNAFTSLSSDLPPLLLHSLLSSSTLSYPPPLSHCPLLLPSLLSSTLSSHPPLFPLLLHSLLSSSTLTVLSSSTLSSPPLSPLILHSFLSSSTLSYPPPLSQCPLILHFQSKSPFGV